MPENKRVFPRFSFSEPVAYTKPNITVNGSIAGNISLGGISLRVQEFVAMGSVLELQIRLEHAPTVIWAKAQVVRIREVMAEDCYEIGLQFIQDEQCTKAINEYINKIGENHG